MTTESIEAQLENTPLSPESIDLMNRLSLTLLKEDCTSKKALSIASDCFDLCKKHFPQYHKGLINALITMGEYYRFQHDYGRTFQLHVQVEEICRESNSQVILDELIRLKTAQVALAFMMSNWTFYIQQNLALIALAQRANRPREEAAGYNSLAAAYGELNDFNEAIRYSEKAIALAKAIGDHEYEAFCLLARSSPHAQLQQFSEAKHYANLAYRYYEGKENKHEAYCLSVLGSIYAEAGDCTKALEFFQRELELVNRIDFPYFKPSVYCDIGMVHQKLGNHASALDWLQAGISLAEAKKRSPVLLHNYPILVKAYKESRDFENALLIMEKYDELKTGIHDSKLDHHRQALLIIHETQTAQLEAKLQKERADAIQRQAFEDRKYFEEH